MVKMLHVKEEPEDAIEFEEDLELQILDNVKAETSSEESCDVESTMFPKRQPFLPTSLSSSTHIPYPNRQPTLLSQREPPPQSPKSINNLQSNKKNGKYSLREALETLRHIKENTTNNEFMVFGQQVGLQLNKLSLPKALELQEQIQTLLTRARQEELATCKPNSSTGDRCQPLQRQSTTVEAPTNNFSEIDVNEESDDMIEFEEDWINRLKEEDGAFESVEEKKLEGDPEEEVKAPSPLGSPLENNGNNVKTGEKSIVDKDESFQDVSDVEIEEEKEKGEEEEEVKRSSSDAEKLGFKDCQEDSRESVLDLNVNNLQPAASQEHSVPQNTQQSVSEDPEMGSENNSHTYKCTACSFTSQYLSQIKEQSCIHTGEKPPKCPICEYSSSNKETLKQHFLIHLKEKSLKHSQCCSETTQDANIKNHEKFQVEVKFYKCGVCDFKAASENNLMLHSINHMRNRPHKCPVCDFKFSYKIQLREHLVIHYVRKPNVVLRFESSAHSCSTPGTRRKQQLKPRSDY